MHLFNFLVQAALTLSVAVSASPSSHVTSLSATTTANQKIFDRADNTKPTGSTKPAGDGKPKACSKSSNPHSSKTTSKKSGSTPTSSSKPDSMAKKICGTNFEGVNGQSSGDTTKKIWDETDMGNLTQSLLDEFVPGVDGKFNQSLPYTIVHQLANISPEGWECNGGSCEMPPNIEDHCEKSNNPYWLFILACLRNFQEATNDMIEMLGGARDTVTESVHKLFDDFSKPLHVDDTIQVVISAVFGAVSMGLSIADPGMGEALEEIGQIATSIGAFSVEDALTQEEQKNEYANALEKVVTDGVERIIDNIKKYQKSILEDVPPNDRWKPYSDHEGSAAKLFKDGSFANQMEASTNTTASHQVEKGLYSGAISYVWGTQEVFVAVAKDTFNGYKPCEVDLKDTEIWRECADDSTAYFLVKAKAIKQPQMAFGDIYGVDKLQNYRNLTLKDVGESSAKATKANGYRGTFKDGASAMDYIKGQKTDRLYFNLMTCFIDDMSHEYVETTGDDKHPSGVENLRQYLMNCENQKDKNGKKFGYSTLCDDCNDIF